MSSKIKIRCPRCTKEYSVPTGLDHKSVRCKQCDHRFKIGDVLPPPTEEVTATVVSPATPTPSPQPSTQDILWGSNDATPPTDPAPISPAPHDAPQSPFASAYSASNVAASPLQTQTQQGSGPQCNHQSSPLMIPAILGSIFLSVAMALVAGAYTWYAVSQPPPEDQLAANDPDNVKRATRSTRPPERNVPETPAREENATRPLVPDPASRDPFGNRATQSNTNSPEPDPESQALRDAQRRRLANEAKLRNEARMEKERKDKEKRAAEDAKREEERVAARKAREAVAAKRVEDRRRRQEVIDNAMPEDQHLIQRIKIDGWGVNDILATDEFVFIADHDLLQVYRWDSKDRVFSRKIKALEELTHLAMNSSQSQIAIGGRSGRIEVYKVDEKGKLLRKPIVLNDVHERDIAQLGLSNDDKYLVSIDRSAKAIVWDLESREITAVLDWDSRNAKSIRFPRTNGSVCISDGTKIQEFSLPDGTLQEERELDMGSAQAMAYSPDKSQFAITNGSDVKTFKKDQDSPSQKFQGSGVQWSVAFGDESTLYTGGLKLLFRWNLSSDELELAYQIPDASYIQIIAISPDGSKAAVSSGSARQDVYLIDLTGN